MKRVLLLCIPLLLLIFSLPDSIYSQGNQIDVNKNDVKAIINELDVTPVQMDKPSALTGITTSEPDIPGYLPAGLSSPKPNTPDDLGDWSNEAALACIFTLGPILNASTVASLIVKPPPFDYPPSAIAFMTNLSLKFCAPYVGAPSNITTAPSGCSATFTQYDMSGKYSNIMGFPSPLSEILPGTDWGDIGTPEVVHWSTDVDVSAKHSGSRQGDQIIFDTGINSIVWRGETLLHPMDLVFIYIPGLGQERETLRTALNAGKFLLDKSLRFIIDAQPNPHGIYNEEVQYVVVTDFVRPSISTSMQNVEVEAIEPGGVSRRTYLGTLEKTITFSDNCDDTPQLIPQNAPNFAAVDNSYVITWEVRDRGPHGLEGGYNSRTLEQTLTVVDTKPPIILAPPPIVTETVTIPAPINMGHPAVFDLADLNPTVNHDACSQPGVVCVGNEVRFPAGQIYVTWTAVDQSGNSATIVQLVNVKSPGSNQTPDAHDKTGADGLDAISYQPITITLTADDADADPLWFAIDEQPDDGFFHAPLLPYFIQDYRLANVNDISFLEYCADPDNQQQYVPTDWPVNANFMAVDDAGNTYVHDQGMIWCNGNGDVSTNYRLAIFRPDGSWEQISSSFDVKDVYVDQRNGFIYTASTDSDVSYVRKFDLDLNQVGSYRIDDADVLLVGGARASVGDEQGIVYATNGHFFSGASQLYLFDVNGPGDPAFLADYSLPGVNWIDMALDSQGNFYASSNQTNGHRIYKFSPAVLDDEGNSTPGELIGWLGKCDYGPGCDIAHGRSFGFSCTDTTCSLDPGSSVDGSGPGQFDNPRGIALDPNDILYVTDYNNLRVQRFTPEGYFAGQAISECDGSCFVLGDFGQPEQVTVNSNHFYVLDDGTDLLHVFETTPLTHIDNDAATIVYQSDNNFVGTDSFTFKVTDGLISSAPAQVDIQVTRNYRPPQADRGLAFTAVEDTPQSITLTGYDPDEYLDLLTFQIDSPPAHGTISGSEPNRQYIPDPDFNGTDTFTFVADDGTFLSEPQTVTMTVTAVNDAPRFPEENHNFAFRLSGNFLDMSRLSTLEDMQIGRGFDTLFKIDFYDPDVPDLHTVTIDWGDGSPVESEGEVLADGTVTGPLLNEGNGGVPGSVTAEHIFTQNGVYTAEVCVTDNVIINGDGYKETTPASVTSCKDISVTVASMTDMLLNIESASNPIAIDDAPVYALTLINNAPDVGPGVTATGIVVHYTLDGHTHFSYADTNDGSCHHANGVITCQLNSLAPGESVSVEIGATLNSGLVPGDRLENEAIFQLNEANQSDLQLAVEMVTVVAPADFIVNTVEDAPDVNTADNLCEAESGDCTLRAAVEQANAQPDQQIIALDYQRYLLEVDLQVTDDLIINGLGAENSMLVGTGGGRVMTILDRSEVTFNALSLIGGQADDDDSQGGGLYNLDGTVLLDEVLISQNYAQASGGGIWNGGELSLNDSAITGNQTDGVGGGIYNEGVLNLTNVTLSGNQAQSGGGIGGGGTAVFTNVTVSNNHATGSGGGLNGEPQNFTLINTILAGNTAVNAGPNCGYGFTSEGFNLVDDVTDCTIMGQTATNIVGQDARLMPLAHNSGQTPTQALLGSSPAVDAGSCLLQSDQRDIERPIDGNLDNDPACDIGAYEFEPLQRYLPIILLADGRQ